MNRNAKKGDTDPPEDSVKRLPGTLPLVCVECMLIIFYEYQRHSFAILIFQEKRKEKKRRKKRKERKKEKRKKTGVRGRNPRIVQQHHQQNSTLTLSKGTMPHQHRP